MKYSFGERQSSPGPSNGDINKVNGEGWTARRMANHCTLSWIGGHLVGKNVTVTISESEFLTLRENPGAFMDIALKHDPDK